MSKLQRYFGAFLAGLFLNAILGNVSTSMASNTDIHAVATPPRESCSMGFSCQSSSCRGGSVIGLCPKKLTDNYTLRLRGKFPNYICLFTSKYYGYSTNQTALILRAFDDNRKPLFDIFFTKESIGISLVGIVDTMTLSDAGRISKGINLDRIDNFRMMPGDELDLYIFYKNRHITVLYKHKNSVYYEVGSILLENKVISSIAPVSGPMDYDINFEQSPSLSIPSTFIRHVMPDNPTVYDYFGPYVVRAGTSVVHTGGYQFEDGSKIVINQGGFNNIGTVVHTFSNVNDSSVRLIVRISNVGGFRYRFVIENMYKRENKDVTFDAGSLGVNHVKDYGITHLGYLFTGGKMLICIADICFVSTDVSGAEIGRIRTNVWFTTSVMFVTTEQILKDSAVGTHACRIGEKSCSGTEIRLQTPLSPGQRVEVQSLFTDNGLFRIAVPVSQADFIGAIAMGDSYGMRGLVLLKGNSVSLTLFSESGAATDLCSVYLSGRSVLDVSRPIRIIIGLSNSNKLGVSGYVGEQIKMYCELDLGSISITKIKPIKNSFHSGVSQLSISNDYPAQGYESISGGSSVSRTQQQAANCYLATNGVCHASKVSHMDGLGFVDGIYVLVKASSVSFPSTLYVRSGDNNSDQLAFTIISTGKFSMRNVNTQETIYTKIPPSCMERILMEGLSLLLSSNNSSVFASVCGFVLGSISSNSLKKKLTYTFHDNMKGTSIQVSTFQVYAGGNTLLDFERETYSASSSNIVKDDDLTFFNPCDARGAVSTRLDACSSLINMSSNRLVNGYSIFITGTVEKPLSSLEQAFNIGIPIDDAIQVFNFKAGNGRTLYQLFITTSQMGISVHNHNGIGKCNPHSGAPIPPNVNLEEGSKYKIGIVFRDSAISMLIEAPYGSGRLSMLKRNLVPIISAWGDMIYGFNFANYEPVRSIVPELLVKSPYSYSLSNNLNTWVSSYTDYRVPTPVDNSCSLPIYGVCTSQKVFMPGNKPVSNEFKLFMRFYTFKKREFTILFKRADGLVVSQIEFSSTSTMWNGAISIKFKTRIDESRLEYNINLTPNEFIISYVGNSLGYYIGGRWRALLALADGDSFNQISAIDLDSFVVEYVRASNSNPSPWQYLNYVSEKARASSVLAYDQCNSQHPSPSLEFSRPGTYFPGSSIENLCSTSMHPNKFVVVFKSRYPTFVKEEVAKTFYNFPGFLQAFVLLYNGSVVYTLVVARKYISFFNSLYSGEAQKFSSCSSQVPNESEFQPGSKFYITFYVDGTELHVYFHSFEKGKSALLCKLPYNTHFNAAKVFGQVNTSNETTASIDYNVSRNLYSPTLNPSHLYPMGTAVTKNVILSSGMPFSPNESLSIEMTCSKDLIFSGKAGNPQLRLSINGSSFTLTNIPGKMTSTGVLYGSCVCSNNKRIVINLAYIRNQFRLIACKASAASIFTNGVSIYQISSESELRVAYRTDIRLAVATSLTSSQITKVEEQPDTSNDETDAGLGDRFIPQSFRVQATLHVIPSYVKS